MSEKRAKTPKDMTEAMEDTLQRLQGRFQALSEQLESNNEMGVRIDGLEKNVADLMTQAGTDGKQISK